MAIRVDLLLAKEKANDKAEGRKCPLPKGLRAVYGRLHGERVTAFLERPRVTPLAPGRVTPPRDLCHGLLGACVPDKEISERSGFAVEY